MNYELLDYNLQRDWVNYKDIYPFCLSAGQASREDRIDIQKQISIN